MSAITGIFRRDGNSVNFDVIKKMNECLSHRGLNGETVWAEGSIGFGHQMTYTTQESIQEILPFHDESSGLIITADARIDNRKELAEELGIEDKFDVPDSVFILKAYQKWGDESPGKLLGDFSFAIWDKRNKKLFCARDHMGIKPFYYYSSDNIFVFASEIKAILSLNEIEPCFNELKMVLDIKTIRNKKGFTYFKNIFSLLPANSLSLTKNEFNKAKYWNLDPDFKIRMESDEEYFKKFREIFSDAVKCRLRSAVPVGFDLSGGLDSSSIVSMTKKLKNKNALAKMSTFSLAYDDFPESDEREYINTITENSDIDHHLIKSDTIKLMANIENVLKYQDQPFNSPFMPIFCNSYKIMHENGIKIQLTGFGGDSVVSHGEKYFLELALQFRWIKLIKEVRMTSKRLNVSFLKILLESTIFQLIPKTFINFLHLLNIHHSYDFLNDLSKRINFDEYLDNNFQRDFKGKDLAKKYHFYSLNDEINVTYLEIIDRNAKNFGIEPRYPFYDKRLVEFCYAIPTNLKYRGGWDRFILRKAMNDILPKEIQWRPKKKFLDSFFIGELLNEKELIKETIIHNEFLGDLINWIKIKEFYQEYGKIPNSKLIYFYKVWYIIIIVLWYKKYIHLKD